MLMVSFSVKGLTFHLRSEFSYGRWGGDDVFGLDGSTSCSRLAAQYAFCDLASEVPP
jgi:hypothetical protein